MRTIFQKLRASSMARSTLAMLGTRVLSILIGVTLSVLLARWLAPEGYGIYLFTLTIAQFLAMPILAGLPTLVIREVAIARDSGDAAGLAGILRWSAGFIMVTFLVVTAVAAVFFFTLRAQGNLSIHFIALPLVLALAFLHMGSALLQGYEHPFSGSLGDGLIRPALLLGLVSLVVMAGVLSPEVALWSHVVAAAVAASFAFGYWLLVCRDRGLPLTQPPRYETRKWLRSLLPLSLVTAASLINSRLDILMLGILSVVDDVARYGIAVQLAGLVVMGQTIVNAIVGPKIARLYRQSDHTELHRTITNAARLSTVIALAVFLAVAVLGAQVIEFLLGANYSGAWYIALVLCCGNLISSAMGPVSTVMSMTGNEKTLARLVWLSALANAILNLILIPIYGVIGAAIATVTAQLVRQVIIVYWSATRLHLHTTILGSMKVTG